MKVAEGIVKKEGEGDRAEEREEEGGSSLSVTRSSAEVSIVCCQCHDNVSNDILS